MYQEFAKVYDEFMQTIPYTVWADYIEQIWKAHKAKPHLILDLACGTGSLTLELAKRGYDMIGADISPEMLEIAQDKARTKQKDILYLMQDMREFELYGTVDSILWRIIWIRMAFLFLISIPFINMSIYWEIRRLPIPRKQLPLFGRIIMIGKKGSMNIR